MAVADRNGLPVSVCAESATPHEVTLAVSTLLQMVVPDAPQNLVGDNAYDSDRLDAEVKLYGIEVIAPHRRNRRNSTQDGRRLKRYRRRWKIERLFAWLQNFRRLVVRYERHAENFLGMLQLASVALPHALWLSMMQTICKKSLTQETRCGLRADWKVMRRVTQARSRHHCRSSSGKNWPSTFSPAGITGTP
jgi:transposase